MDNWTSLSIYHGRTTVTLSRNSKGSTVAHGHSEFSQLPRQARAPQGSLLGAVLFNILHTHTL